MFSTEHFWTGVSLGQLIPCFENHCSDQNKKKNTSHTMCLSPLHQRHFQAWKKMMKTLVISVYFQRWKKPLDRRPYSHIIYCNLQWWALLFLITLSWSCRVSWGSLPAKVYSIWQRVNRQTNRSCIINGSVTIPLFKKRNIFYCIMSVEKLFKYLYFLFL